MNPKKNILDFIIKNLKKDDPLEKIFQPHIGKDRRFVSPVITPKEGGTFTHFRGAKFPFPGLPFDKELHLVASIKGLVPMMLGLVDKSLESIDKNPHEWCETVRELYRVFNIMIEREESEEYKKRWGQLRDAICLTLQYDDAYRARFQNAFSELNVEKLKFTAGDKYWFSRMGIDFPGKKESIKKYGTPKQNYEDFIKEEQQKQKK